MPSRNSSLLIIISLLVVCAIPIIFFSEDRQQQIAALINDDWASGNRWTAALVIVGLFASDMFLPIPATAVCAVAGRLYGVFTGTILCWMGLNISALIGYWLAYAIGWPVVRRFSNESNLATIKSQVDRWGIWPLVALRPIPVLSEASILLLGTYRYPRNRFWPAIIVSNLLVATTFVSLGSWFSNNGQFWIGALISCLLPLLLLAIWMYCFRRK